LPLLTFLALASKKGFVVDSYEDNAVGRVGVFSKLRCYRGLRTEKGSWQIGTDPRRAFGEALHPDKLERLGRYEVHLDRKLERMLAPLLRLKDLRLGTVED
jgi:hypothetical protein